MERIKQILIFDWDAIAGILAAVAAIILHFLHLVQIDILLTVSTVLVAVLFIRQLRRERATEEAVSLAKSIQDGLVSLTKDLSSAKDDLINIRRSLTEKLRTCAELEELSCLGANRFTEDKMSDIWLWLLWRVESTYSATNYMKVAQLYPTGYADAALAAQTAKIRAQTKVTIRKVFIVDEPGELDGIRGTLNEQLQQGIKVRYILHNKIQTDPVLSAKSRDLETIDFGLFDSRIVLLWFLDKRTLIGGKVLVGGEDLQPYKNFFDHLYGEATPYRPSNAKQRA